MTKRIQKLAEQAKNSVPTGLDVDKWIEFYNQKFAELIVRECVQELETSRKCDPYNGDLFDCEYNTCINEQTTMLKEHFGVEE